MRRSLSRQWLNPSGTIATVFAVAVVFVTTSGPALAWGFRGHRAAGRLTESLLTPSARTAVLDLLGPEMSLADASVWADNVRREYPESGPWHYVNVPITSAGYDDKYCPDDKGCVISKIADFRASIADPKASRADRVKSLKFLIHFVQDMHQPLHVGDRSDRGGNDTQVQFFEKGSNAHRVWDSGILEAGTADEDALLADIKALAARPEAVSWKSGGVVDWANESFGAAKAAYTVPGGQALKKGAKLGQAYQDANFPIAEKRLAMSAVRLAVILNAIFAPKP